MKNTLKLSALALMLLGGVAGAQAQYTCSQTNNNGEGININDGGVAEIQGTTATAPLPASTFRLTNQTLTDAVTQYRGDEQNNLAEGSFTWVNRQGSAVRVMSLALGTDDPTAGIEGGRASEMRISFAGVDYFTVTTTSRADTRAGIVDRRTAYYQPLNGARAFYKVNNSLIEVPSSGIRLTQTGGGRERDKLRLFYFILPNEVVSEQGDLKLSFDDVEPVTIQQDSAIGDDINFTPPYVYPAGLCLKEQDTQGGQNYQITGVNLTNLPFDISVPTANTPAPADPNYRSALDTNQPITISSQNTMTERSRVLSVACEQVSILPPELAPLITQQQAEPDVRVTTDERFSFQVSKLSTGVRMDCLISNDSANQYPLVNVTKQIDGERFDASDQFTVTASSATAGNTASATTTGSNATVSTSLVARPTYTSTGLTLTEDSPLPAVTVREVAASGSLSNYTSTLNCTNSAGTTAGLPNNAEQTSATFSPTYNDVVDCTFTNVKVEAPPTVVSIAKDGSTAVAVGGTAATYNITVTNESTAPVSVSVTDTFTPTGLTVTNAADTAHNYSSYDSATGVVTWDSVTLAAAGGVGASKVLKLVVAAPVATAAADNSSGVGQTYTGPKQLSNTATVTVAGNAATTTSAKVDTKVLFAQVNKTVQNVTQGGTAGTSAQAKKGDTLRYCLNFENQSDLAMNLTLKDTVAATQSIPSNFKLNGGTSGFTVNSANRDVNVSVPNVAAGASGSLCFDVTVN